MVSDYGVREAGKTITVCLTATIGTVVSRDDADRPDSMKNMQTNLKRHDQELPRKYAIGDSIATMESADSLARARL